MKKYCDDDFWFDITTGPGANGSGARYYSVRCRKCNTVAQQHASTMSNQTLQKHFARMGWDIGKSRHAHLCPACFRRNPAPPPQTHEPKEKPPNRIDQIWLSMSTELRSAFLDRHANEIIGLLAPRLNEPAHDEAPPPMVENDEPADWWKELHERKASQ